MINVLPRTKRTACISAAASLLVLVSSVIQAEEVEVLGAFKVPTDKYTNADHNGAEIMVFKSDFSEAGKYGLFFMQLLGDYANSAFLCDDAERNGTDKFVRCSSVKNLCDGIENSVKETLTVGKLEGPFCDSMRTKHNPVFGNKPIYEDDTACPDDKCVCYEIKYECWDGSQYGAMCTDEFLARVGQGGVPPGNGAGSGGSH